MSELKDLIYNQMGGDSHDITTDESEMYKFLEMDRQNEENIENGYHMISILVS